MSTPGALTPAPVAAVSTRPPENYAARIRSRWECAFAVGVTLGPLGVLMAATAAPGWLLILLFLGWVMLVPFPGLALLVYALLERDARSKRVLVTAVLALIGSVAALPAVERAGVEVLVSRHGVEFDALAREIMTAPEDVVSRAAGDPPEPYATDPAELASQRQAKELHDRSYRLGIYSFRRIEGGVLLMGSYMLGTDLIYREDLSAELPRGCPESDLRYAGGGWYVTRCREHYDY